VADITEDELLERTDQVLRLINGLETADAATVLTVAVGRWLGGLGRHYGHAKAQAALTMMQRQLAELYAASRPGPPQ
jgi:hypothetical protein